MAAFNDNDIGNLILEELMKLRSDQSKMVGDQARMEGKIDGILARLGNNEKRCVKNFESVFNKLDDHEERITILETRAGKHGWARFRGPTIKIAVGAGTILFVLGIVSGFIGV